MPGISETRSNNTKDFLSLLHISELPAAFVSDRPLGFFLLWVVSLLIALFFSPVALYTSFSVCGSASFHSPEAVLRVPLLVPISSFDLFQSNLPSRWRFHLTTDASTNLWI